MNEIEFKKYLEERKVKNLLITEFIEQIKSYEQYLFKEKLTLETSQSGKILDYSEYLVLHNQDSVLSFLRAIMNYADYSKRYEYITEAIDIFESFNAMDTLCTRIAEIHGEKISDEIFKELDIPPLGVHPEKKPEFTKTIMKRVENKLGKEKTIELLSPCLHSRPPDDIEGDRKLLKDLGIDGFLEKKYQELVKRLEKHRDAGTLEFAQKIDDEIVQFVRDDKTFAQGKREEEIIYVSKLPYKTREFLDATIPNMKKYSICYCPWVRGALKNGTEEEITKDFCYCSAGWYKLYWDQIFEQPISVEPIKTALNGDVECKFAIHLTDDILSSYSKK